MSSTVSAAKRVSPETAEWLDGPRLAEWLESHGLLSPSRQLGSSTEGSFRRWKNGAKANVFAVDRVLVKLGLALSEIPDEFWTCPPQRQAG